MTPGGSILLADDEEKILKTLSRALREDGHEVVTTPSALQAQKLLVDRSFDLLVIDYLMPERTGLENDDVTLAQSILRVPLNPEYTSLNIAQAVLIAAYEWYQAGDGTPARVDAVAMAESAAIAPARSGYPPQPHG